MKEMKPSMQLVYRLIAEGMKTYDEIQQATGWPRSSVRARVSELRKAGLVGGGDGNLFITDGETLEGKITIEELMDYFKEALSRTKVEPGWIEGIVHAEREFKDENLEDAVIVVSDLHIGAYPEAELKKKMDTLLENTIRLLVRTEDMCQINKLHIFLQGDIITGETKYPGQAFEIEFPVIKQLTSFIEHFGKYILSIRQALPDEIPIAIHTVPGNHGVVSKYGSEETNWDNIAYEMLYIYLQPLQNIEIEISPNFYHFVNIMGHRFLLMHGDGINMYQNIPLYGLVQSLMRYQISLGPHDVLVVGHFHSTALMNWSGMTIMINGTAYSQDNYVLKKLKLKPDTRFWMFGVDRHRPITWSYRIDLE